MPGPKPEGASPGAQHGTAAAAKLLIRARRPGCGSSGSIGVTVSLPLLETRFIAFKSQIRKTITRPPTIWRRGNPIQTKGVSPSQVLQIQTEVSPRTLARAAPPVGSWDPSRPESHRLWLVSKAFIRSRRRWAPSCGSQINKQRRQGAGHVS